MRQSDKMLRAVECLRSMVISLLMLLGSQQELARSITMGTMVSSLLTLVKGLVHLVVSKVC